MSANTGNRAGFNTTNTDHFATDAVHKPITTTTNTYSADNNAKSNDGSKSNEATTGSNASETASELNASMNAKPNNKQS